MKYRLITENDLEYVVEKNNEYYNYVFEKWSEISRSLSRVDFAGIHPIHCDNVVKLVAVFFSGCI